MRKQIITVAVASTLLVGCQGKTQKEMGAEIGMAAGMVVGIGVAALTGEDAADAGMAFGAATGALVGGLIGQAIGEKLDEHDAMKAELASLTALKAEDNKPVTWESDKNEDVGGEVRVIETSENTAGNTCKTVNHILNINGSEEKMEQTYCLGSDGSWRLAA